MRFTLRDLSDDRRTIDAIITIENTDCDDYYIQSKIFEWTTEYETREDLQGRYDYSYYYVKEKLESVFNATVIDILEFLPLYY